jgi:hypothetical protein
MKATEVYCTEFGTMYYLDNGTINDYRNPKLDPTDFDHRVSMTQFSAWKQDIDAVTAWLLVN